MNFLKPLCIPLLQEIIRGKIVCLQCGKELKGRRANVHHLDHNPKNNNLKNLTVLCSTCHRIHHIKNGKSIYNRSTAQCWHGDPWFINSFDRRYISRGGISTLEMMLSDDSVSLAAIGRHFGFSRERARQICHLLHARGKQPTNQRTKDMSRKLINIYKYMLDKGIGVGDLSGITGISYGKLTRCLNGYALFSVTEMEAIKKATGLSIGEILEQRKMS